VGLGVRLGRRTGLLIAPLWVLSDKREPVNSGMTTLAKRLPH
jgi:hypothetical protein